MKRPSSILSLFFCAFFVGAGASEKAINSSTFPSITLKANFPAPIKPKLDENPNSRMGFEKNKGQWPNQVEYKADLGSGRRLFFEKNKFTYALYSEDDVYRAHENEHHRNNTSADKINIHAFEMEFVNSNNSTQLVGSDKNSFHYNYFIGNDPSKWASEVPVYKHLTYTNLYEGIDLVAYQRDQVFKYDYIIRAGSAAESIQLKFNGANKLEIRNTNLTIVTSVGDVVESIPYAYQIVDGREVKIECEYRLGSDGKTVSFYFPQSYDSRYELVIDPIVVASTFSGSNQTVYGHCATYDAAGNIYTGGRCFGPGYPVSTGAAQVTFGSGVDIAISKLNPTGSGLLYATYLGGSLEDNPHSMYVNSSNELYVYGTSKSNNYPTTTGAYDVTHNGLSDMIVSKLNPTGTTLMGSTYIGGSSDDGINNPATSYNYGDTYRGEIVLNSNSEVFVVGTTLSPNFPATVGAYDATHNGQQDAVVLKLNSSLTTLQWATYLGGSGDETGCSIRLNSTGEVYVVGLTSGGFPIIPGAVTSVFQGGTYDGYVARLSANGSSLLSSTYVGSGAKDIIYLIDIDINNDVFIYGISEGTFPIVGMVYLNANSENILAKLNPSLSAFTFFTNLGNNTKGLFSPTALLVDLCGNIYMSGWGSVANFPLTTNAVQSTTLASGFHMMVLSQNAGSLLYGSYYGSPGDHVDGGTSRFDPNGLVYQSVCACGSFPTLSSAFAPTKSTTASCDIAVFKLDFQINCNPLITNTIVCLGKTATISITNVNGLVNPSFSIQPGGQVSSTPFFTVAPQVTTTYTLFITGVNGFSAVVTNTGLSTVSIAPVPQISPSLTQAACSSTFNAFDLGLTFLPAGPTPTYNIIWTPTIPFGISTSTQTGSSGGIAPGTYTAFVVAAHGCTNTGNFTIDPIPTTVSFNVSGPFVINCYNPTLTVGASPPTYSYTWLGLTGTFTGSTASFVPGQSGSWTVTAVDPSSGCSGTQTFTVTENITATTSSISPTFQNITCSVTSVITVTVVSNPSVNVTHQWLSPLGGTLAMNNNPAYFQPGAPGVFTCVSINDANGCSVTKTFSVTSSSGFPTFSVTSPQNFTLGCTTRSIATINITNAQTNPIGGAVQYTLIGPPTNTNYVPGANSSYTVNIPGTWTVITKDIANSCESKIQISILQKTLTPQISASVPLRRLTCYVPQVLMTGTSETPNTSFLWSFPGDVGQLQGSTITVNANTVQTTNTLIANYTLTVTDDNNTCKSTTVVTIEQNLFPPNAVISGGNAISCKTSSVTLTNQSSSTIPPYFNPSLPVVGYNWKGPSPQEEKQLATTYVGYLTGTYTMVAQDLNNGCFSTSTISISDQRNYPEIERSENENIIDCGSNGKAITPKIVNGTNGLTYSWISVPGASVSGVDSKSLTVSRSGQYNVTITNTVNGCATSAFIEVINGTLQAAFVADQISGYAPFPVTFTNTSFSSDSLTGKDNITSNWNFGNGTTQSSIKQGTMAPVIYKLPGTYTVTLYANKGACSDTATTVIRVDIPSELIVPNIFTPNGDGNNDLFFVKATNLDNIEILIIDRWGHTVYELNSTTGNVEWDGKNQFGADAAEGVYLYKLKARGKDGQSYNKQGNITLVR